jgi:DNA-binding Lrp family transcriptional regulator
MSTAFVLLNCDIGAENEIISEISGISGVSEATGLSGVYDVIAKVNAESDSGISKIVTKIRSIANIRASLTMVVAEGRND